MTSVTRRAGARPPGRAPTAEIPKAGGRFSGPRPGMIDVSQTITFRKGRAFTTRQPEPPVVPAPPAELAPAVPSAKVSLAGDRLAAAVTYAPHGLPGARVRIDTRPPGAGPEPEADIPAAPPAPAAADPAAAPEG